MKIYPIPGIKFEHHVTTMKNLPRDMIIMEAPHPLIFNIHSFIRSFILRILFHKNSKYFFLSTQSLSFIVALFLRYWSSLFIKLISNSTFKCHTFMICDYVMCAMSTFLNVFLIIVIYLWILMSLFITSAHTHIYSYKHT